MTEEPPLEYACRNASTFLLTADDVQFGRTRGMDGANAIMDKLFYAGFILVEEQSRMLHVTMLKEDPVVYERLMGWLEAEKIRKKTVLRFILWQGGGHRQWEQTVKMTLKGRMFSKNPDKHVTCNRCGRSILKEQVLGTWTTAQGAMCPFCKQPLA